MQTFFIFSKNKYPLKISDNGFYVISLIFGMFWGVTKGIWVASFVNLLLIFITYFSSTSFLLITIISSNIFWGFFGKDLYIQKILRENYIPKKMLNASSKEKALLIYLEKNQNDANLNN